MKIISILNTVLKSIFLGLLLVNLAVASELGDLLQVKPTVDETEHYHAITGYNAKYLPLSNAIMQAVEKNLTITGSKLASDKMQQALLETQAVFDPVFTITVGHSEKDTNERTLFGTVFQKKIDVQPQDKDYREHSCLSVAIDPLTNKPDICLGEDGKPVVIKQRWRKLDPMNKQGLITASAEDPVEGAVSPKKEQFKVNVSQQLPVGGTFNLTETTAYQEIRDTSGRGRTHGAPWTSAMTLGISMPVPAMKGFGEYSENNVATLLAEKADDSSFWQMKSTLNKTLQQVDSAYWDLALAHRSLAVTVDNKELAGKQVKSMARLLERGVVTRYEKLQSDAEYAKAKVAVEQARNRVVTTSLALSILLEDSTDKSDKSTIYVPVGFADVLELEKDLNLDKTNVIKTSVEHNPDLWIKKIAVESGEINHNFKKSQALPDISFNGSMNMSQDGSKFGYRDLVASVGSVLSPDTRSQNYSVAYKHPWGNQAAKSGVTQAEAGLEQSELQLQQTKRQVTRDVINALAALYSAQKRYKSTKQTEKLAQLAYDKLLRKRELGSGVKELEMIVTLRNLINARLATLSAQVAQKKADTALLAAQGILANQYAVKNARTEFDLYRTARLAEAKKLSYFSPLVFDSPFSK